MGFIASGLTDALQTGANSNAYMIDGDLGLVMLCNSIGSSSDAVVTCGQICEEVKEQIKKDKLEAYSNLPSKSGRQEITGMLSLAVQEVNKKLYANFNSSSATQRMIVSLDLILFLKNYALLGHIGNTRTHAIQKDMLFSLTEDHIFLNDWINRKICTLETGKAKPGAFDLYKGLGMEPLVNMEFKEHLLVDGERFLVTTGSVHRTISDTKLLMMVNSAKVKDFPSVVLNELKDLPQKDGYGALFAEVSLSGNPEEVIASQELLKRFEIIRQSVLFHDLSQQEVLKILSLVDLKQVSPGDFLIREGTASYELYFILDGQVGIRSKGVHRGYCERGDVIGEMSAFDHSARSADVIATRLTLVMAINNNELTALLERDPVLGNKVFMAVIKELSSRMKKREAAAVPKGMKGK